MRGMFRIELGAKVLTPVEKRTVVPLQLCVISNGAKVDKQKKAEEGGGVRVAWPRKKSVFPHLPRFSERKTAKMAGFQEALS